MSESLRDLDARLGEFIEQPDRALLILSCGPHDIAVPAKLLEARGRQDRHGTVILGVGACPKASQWMDEIIAMLGQQLEVAQRILGDSGLPVWPRLPLRCSDPRLDPAKRLRAAAEHVAELLPKDEPIVWALLPSQCSDRAGYAHVVRSLVHFEPWIERHRFVVWDDRESPAVLPELVARGNDDAWVIDLDFSAAACLDELVRTAGDPARPADVRMDALFQLAAADFAYQRYGDAADKYGVLYKYYEDKDPVRQALCLGGAGDIAVQVGTYQVALDRYRSGLVLAVEAKSLPAMLQLLLGAGKACLKLGLFAEAEGYFGLANDVAGTLMNAYAKADAMELRGVAQKEQRSGKKIRAALETWDICRQFCERFAYEERWRSVQDHELALYEAAQMHPEAVRVRARIALGFERAAAQAAGAGKKAKAS